jgi:hypothetical protein
MLRKCKANFEEEEEKKIDNRHLRKKLLQIKVICLALVRQQQEQQKN